MHQEEEQNPEQRTKNQEALDETETRDKLGSTRGESVAGYQSGGNQ